MQQQVLQAMLVACISESDPTVRPKGERNDLLKNANVCGSLLSQVAAKLPALLDPLTGTASTASTDKSKIKTPPDPKIKALQQKLIGCGAHIEADGYWGALTLAAAEQYDCGGAAPPPGEK